MFSLVELDLVRSYLVSVSTRSSDHPQSHSRPEDD